MPESESGGERAPWRVHDLSSNDPSGRFIDRSDLSDAEVAEIDDIMASLVALRAAEAELSAASQRYMHLNQTDMKAVHYLIAAGFRGETATAGSLRAHLGISSGATTKLLDRLESGGHLHRQPHPDDRRSLTFTVADETREAAMMTIGRQQMGRFRAAAELSSAERLAVRRFLDAMTAAISPRDEAWAQETRSG